MITSPERDRLRTLGARLMEHAASPEDAQKRCLWAAHNALKPVRPPIFVYPYDSWPELVSEDALLCQDAQARIWERFLCQQLFWAEEIGDDHTVEAAIDIAHVLANPLDWGMRETKVGGGDGRAYRWQAPLTDYGMLDELRFPRLEIDWQATSAKLELAHEVFDGVMPVRLYTRWLYSVSLTDKLAQLRGLENLFYDFVDNPKGLHRAMGFLHDGTLALMRSLEEQNLLGLNNGWDYTASGAVGWSDELPGGDYDPQHVKLHNLWGFAESQETHLVGPEMFREFIFPYQQSLLAHFGLNGYGCCEPLNARWDSVRQFPNLRRVSVAPWSDFADMAEKLGDRYIYSLKPNPAHLAVDVLDETFIRAQLRDMLTATRGCRLEIIMKDTQTFNGNPNHVKTWCRLAKEAIGNL